MTTHTIGNKRRIVVALREDEVGSDARRVRRVIVVIDVAESVRLMQAHEADIIDRWRRFVAEVQAAVLPVHAGRCVKSLGDGLLLEFEHVPSSVSAAFDLQQRVATYNVGRPPDAHLALRIGINLAEVVRDALDIFGSGVNIAARLASLAEPGEIVASAAVRDALVAGLDVEIEDLGECHLKHVSGTVRAYRLGPAAPAGSLGFDASLVAIHGPALAVLPFSTVGGNTVSACFGEVVSDELIAALSRSSELRVISRLSTAPFRTRAGTPRELRAHLAAAYVVSGRVIVESDIQLRVSVELAETKDEAVLFADTAVGTPEAFLRPDGEALQRMLSQLASAVCAHEIRRAHASALPTLDSHAILLGAIASMHRAGRQEFERAYRMLDYLVEREPRHAAAHAWLSKWHVLRVVQGRSPDRDADFQHAKSRVDRALDLNAESSLAWAMDGLVHAYLKRDMRHARASYDSALQVNPSESLAWLCSSTLRAYVGDADVAAQDAERAISLSPLDPLRYFFDSLAATAMLASGRWERAVELAHRSLRANRYHASTWRTLAYALVELGRLDEARAAVDALREIDPGLTVSAFRDRFPGRDGPMGEPWAQALAAAGLPP
jgi:adenylate cyclase